MLGLPEGRLADQPNVQELIKQAMSGGMEAGIEAGRKGQDPVITEMYEKARDSK